MYVQTPTHKFEESNTARHEHEGMAEQSENVEYAGAAVASPLRQRNAEDLPGVTSALKERSAARPRGRLLVNSPQTARQAALRAMWDEAATENCGQYNRLEVPHMLLDDVRSVRPLVDDQRTPRLAERAHCILSTQDAAE